MAALFPLMLFAQMFLLRSRLSLSMLSAVFLVSDLRMTLLPEYWKDDYRGAVRDIVARESQQVGSIDWAADDRTANYYGLALAFPGAPAYAGLIAVGFPRVATGTSCGNLDQRSVEALLRQQRASGHPVYLALSKPDLYDVHQGWRLAIRRHEAKDLANYRAFSIYVFR